MRDIVERQAVIEALNKDPMGGLNYRQIIETLPSAELDNNSTEVDSENDKLTSRQEVVSILSELRSQYNCFDEHEEPVYHALSEAIQELREPERKTCNGCKHLGDWENERECGYNSPCTECARIAPDNYSLEEGE